MAFLTATEADYISDVNCAYGEKETLSQMKKLAAALNAAAAKGKTALTYTFSDETWANWFTQQLLKKNRTTASYVPSDNHNNVTLTGWGYIDTNMITPVDGDTCTYTISWAGESGIENSGITGTTTLNEDFTNKLMGQTTPFAHLWNIVTETRKHLPTTLSAVSAELTNILTKVKETALTGQYEYTYTPTNKTTFDICKSVLAGELNTPVEWIVYATTTTSLPGLGYSVNQQEDDSYIISWNFLDETTF